MTDEPATHGWRIRDLERKMDKFESRMLTAMYLLIVNLLGVIGLFIVNVLARGR